MKDEDKYRVGNIYINKEKNYISYIHPTQKNENGHVKQVTRSIKNYTQEEIALLCKEINDLLDNFTQYTKDFEEIYIIEKKSETKAFQWIIAEEIVNKVEEINKSTLEKFVPISNYSQNIWLTLSSHYTNMFKNLIPTTLHDKSYDGKYIVVNNSNLTELTAVINFKVFQDFEDEIINMLVFIIGNYNELSNSVTTQELVAEYINLNLSQVKIEVIENHLKDIWSGYSKEYKLKKYNEENRLNFNNFVIKRLQNENRKLVILFYDIITEVINENTSFLSKVKFNEDIDFKVSAYKLKENTPTDATIISKILYFKFNYKDNREIDVNLTRVFFEILDTIFAFNKHDKTLSNHIKTIRLSGNFNNNSENYTPICIAQEHKNYFSKEMYEWVKSENLTIPIDGILTKDYMLSCLLEQIIVLGLLSKCNFVFTNTDITKENPVFIKENLLKMLSKNNCIKQFKYIYSAEILDKFNSTELTEPECNLDLYIFSDLGNLNKNIKDKFKKEVEEYFYQSGEDYLGKVSISNKICNIMLDIFTKSLYMYLLNPENIIEFTTIEKKYLIQKYNLFLQEHLNAITTKLNEISMQKLDEIFKTSESITDYTFYKKVVMVSISTQIEIPYSYFEKICDEFKSYLKK